MTGHKRKKKNSALNYEQKSFMPRAEHKKGCLLRSLIVTVQGQCLALLKGNSVIEVFIVRDQAGKLRLKSQQTSEGTFVHAQARVSFH